MTIKLFRPVGLFELGLVWDAEMKRFPSRLPHQPIFYPVTTAEYARQIARDWNVRDPKSGFSGFVTAFDVDPQFLSRYELHTVGSSQHEEYWIPAGQLKLFNDAVTGRIEILEAFFGEQFTGFVPDKFGLEGRNVIDQFKVLWSLMDYAPFDLSCETSANRKAFFLNYLFWATHDFTNVGITNAQRDECLKQIRNYWIFNKIPVPLPAVDNR